MMVRCAMLLALSVGCQTPPPESGSDEHASGSSDVSTDTASTHTASTGAASTGAAAAGAAAAESISTDTASTGAATVDTNTGSGGRSNGAHTDTLGVTASENVNSGDRAEPSLPPTATRPTTILAPARAGRISTDAVRRVIEAKRGEVGACYEEGLNRNANLEGQANVRFLVGPDGHVDDAEVYQSTLGDPQVESCITTAMRSWEFPRPRPRGRSVLLTYPYVLSTE